MRSLSTLTFLVLIVFGLAAAERAAWGQAYIQQLNPALRVRPSATKPKSPAQTPSQTAAPSAASRSAAPTGVQASPPPTPSCTAANATSPECSASVIQSAPNP